jgi:carbonic anhydrase/acetyltransferase-like protein (isoleucine patch superfamily)
VTGLEWNYELPDDAFIAPGARVTGDVRLGSQASIWYGAAVEGEDASVEIAPTANVQDNALVRALPGHPVVIAAGTTVGHNARVIGATVGPSSLVAIGSTVLAGANVGANSIVAANATVPAGMQVPPGSLILGAGRIARQVTEAEVDRIKRGEREYVRLASEHLATLRDLAV